VFGCAFVPLLFFISEHYPGGRNMRDRSVRGDCVIEVEGCVTSFGRGV
jgi:hypothetical protein